jgi:hypothetical protein
MLFKFTLVAINLGTTGLTLYEWRKMNAAMRVFAIVIVVMTFVASIPPFIEGLEFIIARSWPIVSFFLNIRILILLLAIVAFSIFIGFILIDEWEPNRSSTGAIKWRAICSILLSASLAMVFWLVPGLELATLSSSPNEAMVFGFLFAAFWFYLVVQGYQLSHGLIGSSSTHNLDNIISALPALVALFGGFVSAVGFWSLSGFNIVIAVMTLQVALYDIWILGGAAAKINRLTDEFKI